MSIQSTESQIRPPLSNRVAVDQSEQPERGLLDLSKLEELDEGKLLAQLQIIYERKSDYPNVLCEKFTPEQRIDFQRKAAVYHRQMHNKFFVPVWAAAMLESDGYILYPKLTPLREVLPIFKICQKPTRDGESKMVQFMRRCFLPVAMGLDALHTPIPNHRTMYYHRDLCIDNVYLYPSAVGEGDVYGDAMLKFSKLTRGSHEQERLDSTSSISANRFVRKYYHHPSPWKHPVCNVYHRRHDWFSFAVYILDVMIHLLCDENEDFPPLESTKHNEDTYNDLVDRLEAHVNTSLTFRNERSKQFILHHLSVARTCLSLTDEEQVQALHYELPDELKLRFKGLNNLSFTSYHFEYGVSEWTAQLLWLYDDSRSEEIFQLNEVKVDKKPEHVKAEKAPEYVSVCQACLLRPIAKIPTRTYRRGEGERQELSKCDKNCYFYCIQCYTNKERLFCPNQHGTTSTIIGGHSSYALILYGDDSSNTFKKDATTIENVLQHKLICGIPDRNVSVRPVFDPENPGTEEKCLEEACLDMRRRIHNRQLIGSKERETDSCVNDASYTLFIFYSGHGAKGGHWTPYVTCSNQEELREKYTISRDRIDDHLENIRRCTNTSNPSCDTQCIEVTYIMDHCYTVVDDLKVAKKVDNQKPPSSTIVTTEPETLAKASTAHNSELTRWFCELLRCVPLDHKDGDDCDICEDLQRVIHKKCHGAFINGHCLELNSGHISPMFGFESETPRVKREVRAWPVAKHNNLNVVAYYQPKGIYYKVFSYKEGREPVEVRFHCQVTCEQVKKELIAELKKKDEEKERRRREYSGVQINICLLANLPDDHSKYTLVSDDAIRSILDSSLLFYHVITQPVQVLLVAATGHDIIKDTLSELELDKTDLLKLVNDCNKENPNPTVYRFLDMPTSQLPNIFVHIVHHLRYKEYQGGVTAESRGSRSSSSSPSDGHQLCQPSTSQDESDVSDQERVRNSFASLLYRVPRTGRRIKDFSPADWEELEGEAIQYLRGNRNREFDLRVEADNLLRVQWHMSSLELPLPDSLTRTRNVSEAGQYQSDDEVLPVLQSSPADDEDGYDG